MGNNGKYTIKVGEIRNIFEQCPRTQLKNKVKEVFKMQRLFYLQNFR